MSCCVIWSDNWAATSALVILACTSSCSNGGAFSPRDRLLGFISSFLSLPAQSPARRSASVYGSVVAARITLFFLSHALFVLAATPTSPDNTKYEINCLLALALPWQMP